MLYAPLPANNRTLLGVARNNLATRIYRPSAGDSPASVRNDPVALSDEIHPSSLESSPAKGASSTDNTYSPCSRSSDTASDVAEVWTADDIPCHDRRGASKLAVMLPAPGPSLKREVDGAWHSFSAEHRPVKKRKNWINPKNPGSRPGIADGAASIDPGSEQILISRILDRKMKKNKTTYYFVESPDGNKGWQRPENLKTYDPRVLEDFNKGYRGHDAGILVLDAKQDPTGAQWVQVYFVRTGCNQEWRNVWVKSKLVNPSKLRDWSAKLTGGAVEEVADLPASNCVYKRDMVGHADMD